VLRRVQAELAEDVDLLDRLRHDVRLSEALRILSTNLQALLKTPSLAPPTLVSLDVPLRIVVE